MIKGNVTSWGMAVLVFAAATLINIVIFNGLRENNSLKSKNNGERSLNDFTMLLRQYDSPEEAMKAFEQRYETTIIGIGGYSNTGEILLAFGEIPERLPAEHLPQEFDEPRVYIHNRENRSLVILQRRHPRPDEHFIQDDDRNPVEKTPEETLFNNETSQLFDAEIFYWEIGQPGFWSRVFLYRILFPGTEIILAALIIYVFYLIRKNIEYRKRIEEQKNLVLIGTAASTLAHEIKNPLSVIRLQTELIERAGAKDISRELSIINEETERLALLSMHVKDYLRDPIGNPEKMDPAQVLKEHARRILGRETPVTTPAEGLYIRFDPARFQSVAENLLTNARESGSDPDGITIKVERKGKMVRMEIADRGRGISPEELERIFDPFFTTKSIGTGVGLAVVQRFVKAAKGIISIENRAGGGVTVSMELPEYRDEGTDS